MTHRLELFDSTSFKTLSRPIAISLRDNSEIFTTGKGLIHLIFNIEGKKKEGRFEDVLYIPELKVTLLSVRQSTRLPHCKVIFNNNICEYIDKNTNEVITCAYTSNNADLYSLDAILVAQKVAANLTSSSSQSININILHRHLGHLRIDNCHVIVNHCLVDGVDKIVGKEFCEGCAYGHSKQKHHPSTGTKTKQ
jgi:GAG-pre-integrase domain